MRKWIVIALAAIMLLGSETAHAAGPANVAGSATWLRIVNLNVRIADENTFLSFTQFWAVLGDLSGVFQEDVEAVIHATGDVNAHVRGTLTGSAGTLDISGAVAGEPINPNLLSFHLTGSAVGEHGTGQLEGSRCTLRLDVLTFQSFTYFGQCVSSGR